MADIELIIRISEEDYEIMKHNIAVNNPLCPLDQEEMVSKVASGIPLPKGHGRLIDADAEIKKIEAIKEKVKTDRGCIDVYDGEIACLELASTVIEADKVLK